MLASASGFSRSATITMRTARVGRFDFRRQRFQPILAPRDQRKVVAIAREHARQFAADA